MIDDSKVRERAYELWEKDGRREGSEEFYWRCYWYDSSLIDVNG